ncbi:Transcription factor LHW [Arachis hypogaea]|nr:Transcription factor LHW [Arachis hypogaea]
MGFLLKEALKTLCGRNQWSYAVFWKIGCNNSKLLIWEECYYEPLPCSFPQPNFGNGEGSWFSSESHSSQMGIQEEDRVCSLINKMTVNNSVNITGEGIIGRAAFTGNHQWILFNNFSRDAYPPEVYAEMHHQLSAGMQVLIPVLPHGVVQLGSFLPIMENIGFVNDVKSLILQLGCIPGALLSEDYSENPSIGRALGGLPVSVEPPAIPSHCVPSVSNGSNEQKMNNFQGSVLTPKTHNLSQISNGYCQPNATTLIKTNFAGQSENRVVEAEVIPSSRGSCLQQPSVSYNARSAFNGLSSFGQSVPSDCNLKYMEQQMMSVRGNQGHSNPSINASSTLNMSLLKTDGGHILDHNQSSSSASLLAGIPIHGGVSSLLRTSLVTDSGLRTPDVSVGDLSGAQGGGVGVKSDGSSEAGGSSLSNLFSHSGSFTVPPQGSDQKLLSVDVKHVHDALPSKPVTTGGQSPDFVQDCVNKHVTGQSMVKNVKQEQVCAQPSSANTENMDKKLTCMNMQGMNSDYYSASEAISESAIFSGTGTDHLLDAVCSIDALLERTIKHMLFLQSVTKHAYKLKQTGDSKIISKEGGLLLKDNFEGGATWAYEVGSQSMVCPIIVEDLNHPRQMLVEMLCEERGFFLEIADLIKGFGVAGRGGAGGLPRRAEEVF